MGFRIQILLLGYCSVLLETRCSKLCPTLSAPQVRPCCRPGVCIYVFSFSGTRVFPGFIETHIQLSYELF